MAESRQLLVLCRFAEFGFHLTTRMVATRLMANRRKPRISADPSGVRIVQDGVRMKIRKKCKGTGKYQVPSYQQKYGNATEGKVLLITWKVYLANTYASTDPQEPLFTQTSSLRRCGNPLNIAKTPFKQALIWNNYRKIRFSETFFPKRVSNAENPSFLGLFTIA